MMKSQKIKTTNIISFKIDGKISEPQLEALFNDIDTKAAEENKVRLLGEIVDFNGFVNAQTILTGMQRHMVALSKVEKYALVSQQDWVPSLVKKAAKALSKIDLKAFKSTHMQEAKDWLKRPPTESALGLRRFIVDQPAVIGMVVHGKMSQMDHDFMENELDKVLRSNDKAALLLEIQDTAEENAHGFGENMKQGVSRYTHIDKVAVIGKSHHKKWVNANDFSTTEMEMKHFASHRKAEALAWVK